MYFINNGHIKKNMTIVHANNWHIKKNMTIVHGKY